MSSPAKPNALKLLVIVACAMGLAVIGAYHPVLQAAFITYDDPAYVTANPMVRAGVTIEGLRWAFTQAHSSNWHPVTWISHMLDCQLYGLNPMGHHATNLLLHAINAVLVLLLLRGMTGSLWRSALVATFFALHPLRVESVAWVSERKDVLSAFFGLLTLLAYATYAKKTEGRKQKAETGIAGKWLWYGSALGLYALGLMSKPMLVTWPFLMLLLDYWPLQRFTIHDSRFTRLRPLIAEKIPFFTLAAASCVVTVLVQKHGGAVAAAADLTLWQRLANACIGYGWYVWKLFWPVDLAIIYPLPPTPDVFKAVIAAGLVGGLSMLALYLGKSQHRFAVTGWFWFAGTLVPVSGLMQVGLQAYADRYTYLPHVGLLIMIIWMTSEFAQRWQRLRFIPHVLGLAALCLCSAMTLMQARYWRDAKTLFEHAITVTRDNFIAQHSLGQVLADERQYERATSLYLAALQTAPGFGAAWNDLGYAYAGLRKHDLALDAFRRASALKPADAGLRNRIAAMLFETDDPTNAAVEAKRALELAPDLAEAHYNLGNALSATGSANEAELHYRHAIELKPGETNARLNLALLLARQGRREEAVTEIREVIRLKPDESPAHYCLGVLLEQQRQTDDAVAAYAEALRLQSDFAGVLNNLAWLRATHAEARIRNGAEAVRLAERACELTQHEQPLLVGTLAAAYAEAGRFADAVRAAEKAITLASATGNDTLVRRNRELLELYRAGKPYRDEP